MIDAVRTIATYLVVAVYILIAGPPGILFAILTGITKHLYLGGHLGVHLGLALSGVSYRVIGAEHLPRGRAAIYCANHQSNLDPPVLFTVLHPEMRILYKAEMNSLPILGRVFRLGGFIPVDRQNKEEAVRSIDAAAESVRRGNSFLIFPEGTRNRANELLPFKKGGFIMAIKAQAPIVPIAVRGGREAMRKGSMIIRPVELTIAIGQPIETLGMTIADRDRLISEVRGSIERLLRT